MPSVEFITLGKGRLHFGGGISGIQLQGRPFIVYFLSERIQLEFLIAQCFSDTDALLHGTGIMVDMILFGKLYQLIRKEGTTIPQVGCIRRIVSHCSSGMPLPTRITPIPSSRAPI